MESELYKWYERCNDIVCEEIGNNTEKIERALECISKVPYYAKDIGVLNKLEKEVTEQHLREKIAYALALEGFYQDALKFAEVELNERETLRGIEKAVERQNYESALNYIKLIEDRSLADRLLREYAIRALKQGWYNSAASYVKHIRSKELKEKTRKDIVKIAAENGWYRAVKKFYSKLPEDLAIVGAESALRKIYLEDVLEFASKIEGSSINVLRKKYELLKKGYKLAKNFEAKELFWPYIKNMLVTKIQILRCFFKNP